MCREPGGVEVLEIVDVPRPEPAATDLLVRNFATALNRADLLQRRGLYPPPAGDSEVLGLEFAGEVAETGSEVRGFQRGDRVFGLVGGGGYGEFVTVHHRMAVPVPDNFSYEAAAAVPEAFYTANESLFTLGRLEAKQVALVHAAASGVGTAAVQIAAACGATVIATAGTAEKVEQATLLGATRAVNYREEDFVEVVQSQTNGKGVHIILDLVGAKYWERNLACLRQEGRLLLVGFVGGARVNADLSQILFKRIAVIGTALRSRSVADKIAITQRFVDTVLPLLERAEVKPVVDSVFPLEDVRAAHEHMEANRNTGKIVLRL
jgi:putative PIG3 family NAD(P)H quinone oxidoreductase